ncbi:hypothetical protein B0H13DRAFT_1903620 [Mycena leptocephala]|nr:hypothetical protein B0H13DRAFT_1903620 [Mycena leptocephala]
MPPLPHAPAPSPFPTLSLPTPEYSHAAATAVKCLAVFTHRYRIQFSESTAGNGTKGISPVFQAVHVLVDQTGDKLVAWIHGELAAGFVTLNLNTFMPRPEGWHVKTDEQTWDLNPDEQKRKSVKKSPLPLGHGGIDVEALYGNTTAFTMGAKRQYTRSSMKSVDWLIREAIGTSYSYGPLGIPGFRGAFEINSYSLFNAFVSRIELIFQHQVVVQSHEKNILTYVNINFTAYNTSAEGAAIRSPFRTHLFILCLRALKVSLKYQLSEREGIDPVLTDKEYIRQDIPFAEICNCNADFRPQPLRKFSMFARSNNSGSLGQGSGAENGRPGSPSPELCSARVRPWARLQGLQREGDADKPIVAITEILVIHDLVVILRTTFKGFSATDLDHGNHRRIGNPRSGSDLEDCMIVRGWQAVGHE